MRQSLTNSLFDTPEDKKIQCSNIITVAIDTGVDDVFDYLLPDKLLPVYLGQRVEVPFGRANKLLNAFCIDIKDVKASAVPLKKLKLVKKIVDNQPLLDEKLLKLGKWISDYYVCPLGEVLSAMLPAAVKKNTGTKNLKSVYLAVEPVLEKIRGKKQKQIIEALIQCNAKNSDSSVQVDNILEQAKAGMTPLKRLLESGIIKFTSRTVYSQLPVIPKGLILKTDSVVLNNDQKKALAEIEERIDSHKFSVALLHGVTDSGKTEVYIKAIEKTLAKGKNAIVLLPEIALTTQTIQRFSSRFDNIAVMHSQLTASQRNAQWQKIKNTSPIVVIGARSAVFAPVSDLGIIVVDEEHEPSYKQDMAPRYNGRDVAIKLAQLSNALCVLGSATPSLETLHNCTTKKHFIELSLPKRVMNLPKPQMKIVDMASCRFESLGVNLISSELEEAIRQTLQKKEQVILLLNRRGYSNFIFCPSCRYTLKCRNCDVTLTFHKSEQHQIQPHIKNRIEGGFAVCHYCLAQTLVPKTCPMCGKNITMIGLGTQRLEDELKRKIPSAHITRVDSDSMQKHDYYRLLGDFDAGRIDILAGTQILAKGLHFPNVTLVGIISADTSLQLPDFRANERTYQLICQVAGRTGRSSKGGTVLIQTFLPSQPAICYAANDDFSGFVRAELKHRLACNLPPFGRIALVRLRDTKFDRLSGSAQIIAEQLSSIISSSGLDIKLTGPISAVIARIQRFHRMQIILQAKKPSQLGELLGRFRRLKPPNSFVQVQIDVDPVNLL